MSSTEIPTEKEKEIETQKKSLVAQANALTIETDEDLHEAVSFGRQIKSLQDEVKKTFAEPKDMAWKAHKAIVAAEKKHLQPLEEAEATVKRLLVGYHEKKEAERKREEERLLKEAQEKAEAARQEEIKRQEEERLALAQDLASQGDMGGAEEVLETPIHVAPAIPDVPRMAGPTKVAGMSTKKKFKFKISDPRLVPCRYHKIDEALIQKEIDYRGELTRIPGIDLVNVTNVSLSKAG